MSQRSTIPTKPKKIKRDGYIRKLCLACNATKKLKVLKIHKKTPYQIQRYPAHRTPVICLYSTVLPVIGELDIQLI